VPFYGNQESIPVHTPSIFDSDIIDVNAIAGQRAKFFVGE
jgi:hypothetical protein